MYQYEHERKEVKLKWDGYRPSMPEPNASLWIRAEEYLLTRGLDAETAWYNGWYAARYRGSVRIIIPCSNKDGVPYFQGRALGDDVELRYASPFAPRDDSIVLVWPRVTSRPKGTVVVEGPMDALAAAMEGYLGIGLMGNQPTTEVITHLSKFASTFPPVLIVPDADALEMGPDVLCALSQMNISGMILAPARKDLAAMSRKERRSFLHA